MVRIASVDTFRFFAVVAIIIIHTTAFDPDISPYNQFYLYAYIISDQLSRFAVPFFFIIAGYFWGVKINQGGDLVKISLKMAKRIGIIFIAWNFIYLLPINLNIIINLGMTDAINLAYSHAIDLIQHPVTLIMQGTKIHLWFLIGILSALLITTFFVYIKNLPMLVIVAIGLYFFGVLAKAYSDTPIGIDINFNTRNGPFFSTILFVTGYLTSQKKPTLYWMKYGIWIFSFGCILHFTEIFTLWVMFGTWPKHDFVFGTYFMGLGTAFIALSNHPLFQYKILGKIGNVSLGVYAVHYIFVDLLLPIDKASDNIMWEISFVLLVFLLSLMATILLAKNKYTRKIVI